MPFVTVDENGDYRAVGSIEKGDPVYLLSDANPSGVALAAQKVGDVFLTKELIESTEYPSGQLSPSWSEWASRST